MRISGNFRKIIVLCISVITISTLFVLLSGGCYKDQRKDPLSQEEREWLTKHDGKIVLAHDPSAKPIDFIDENGEFRGLAADYVALLEKRLNFKFNIVQINTWEEVIRKAKKREIDVLCAFTKNPQREKWMLFTEPYIVIPTVILTRKDIKGTLTLDKMKDMKVTFTNGWVIDDFLRSNYSNLDMLPAIDEKTAMNYVSMGQADAWVTALSSASIQTEEYKITNLRVAGETELSFKLAMASRKDWPMLNHILKKGLTLIPKKERSAIFNKWIHIERKGLIYSKKFWIYLASSSGIILMIIIVTITWNLTLRRQVKQRTQELTYELTKKKQAHENLKQAKEALQKARDGLEQEVTARTEELKQANEELTEYASAVSHDLKTPLRAIRNYADFLREDLEGTLDGDQKQYLDGVGRAALEADTLVGDLLVYSRIGRMGVSIETIDIGVFLRQLIDSLPLPPDTDIIMSDNWPSIDAESVLIRQIFQNLIDNAIKFNNSPEKRIELGWQALENQLYEFFVRDNGIGIEPRHQEQIFRVFERLHTKEEYDGTGIGLPIVKKAAEKLRGSVRVESKPEKGSTFFVILPKT